ncbi:MAG: hypothetical protein P8189_20780 [Anaerolineae bacterium]
MMDMDVYASERLMYQRVDEERQLAELRRVQREVGEARQGRLGQWRSQVLAQLGGLFVSVGQRRSIMMKQASIYPRWRSGLLGLVLLVLVVVALVGVMAVLGRGDSQGTVASLEAASARWTALGASYAPDYEAIVAVNSARWAALGESYTYSAVRATDSARWTSLGASYAPDYEAITAVSSARWAALGESFRHSAARAADSARWSALGTGYAPNYEAIAEVNSARWAALGEWYTAEALMGQ